MKRPEVDPILGRVNGYWPTPAMTAEETLAWAETLTGRLRITAEEATTILLAEAESGREWRPRAGEMVALTQALRRRRALEQPHSLPAQTVPELEETTEKKSREEWVAEARAALAAAQGPLAAGSPTFHRTSVMRADRWFDDDPPPWADLARQLKAWIAKHLTNKE